MMSCMVVQKKPWSLRSSSGREESYVIQRVVLPGPSSSACGYCPRGDVASTGASDSPSFRSLSNYSAALEKTLAGSSLTKGETGCLSIMSTLISLPDLSDLLSVASSISGSPPPIKTDPHVIKPTKTKGLGMFARRDIERGELIAWERPALIVPALKREERSEDVYRLLAEAFFNVDSEGQRHATEEIREAGKLRYEEVRVMAISSCFSSGHWVEGVVRTNALVLEFRDSKNSGKEGIYGGVYPLINRCNHSCVPNAAVQFMPSLLTLSLYALRDIKAGEEITKSYVNPLLPREMRKKTLKENYGFECGCRACDVDAFPLSDENRIELIRLLATPTFTRWSSDMARGDKFLAERHLDALRLIEKEEVFAVEAVFLEEMALACALLGDKDGFRFWAEKVVNGVQWAQSLGLDSGTLEVGTEKEGWRKWVWCLEDPEKRVKRWGWRRRMREEMSKRKDVELETGVLEGIFGSLEE